MAGASSEPELGRRPSARSGSEIFLQYYTDNDIFLSPEGILKIISVVACIVSSALFLRGDRCGGSPVLVTSSASTALAVAAATALLVAGVALGAPLLAPQLFLYTDIIVSSVAGVLLLVTGALSVSVCEPSGALLYLRGVLAIATAGTLVASAAATYCAATRPWDAPAPAPPGSRSRAHRPRELEV